MAFWDNLLAHYGHCKNLMLDIARNSLACQEGVGFYKQNDDTLLVWVVKGGYMKEFNYGRVHFNVHFIGNLCRFYVGT